MQADKPATQTTLTDAMIEAGAKAIHDDPPPPQMSAIDWMEMPEHVKNQLRHMARVSYLAMESARANRWVIEQHMATDS